MIKTVKCRMVVTDVDRLALNETLKKFADACNDALAYAKESGRTYRFALQGDLYHELKKRHGQDRFIALEDLTGIRERTAKHGRHHRRRMGRWAFFQLRQFIQYKAEEKGVLVVMVDPRNTSKTCPICRELGSRVKHRFSCGSCGFTGDADIVGARNIAVAGDAVKRPEVA